MCDASSSVLPLLIWQQLLCRLDSLSGIVSHHAWFIAKQALGCCRSTEQDVTSVVGAVNATTIFLGALYSLNVLPVVSVERAVYYRERSSYFYHSLPFSLAQCTVELPYIFVQACVYSCIVYWCCGLEVDVGELPDPILNAASCFFTKS